MLVTRPIGSLPAFRVAAIVHGCDRNAQELSALDLLRFRTTNYATQNHIRHSGPRAQPMKGFNMRPLVLTRNIFDVIVSISSPLRYFFVTRPLVYVPARLSERSSEETDLPIVDMMYSRCLNFFNTAVASDNAVWLSDRSLTSDPVTHLDETLPESETNLTKLKMGVAIEPADEAPRKTQNKGVLDRNDDYGPSIVERVYALTACYVKLHQRQVQSNTFASTFGCRDLGGSTTRFNEVFGAEPEKAAL